MNIALGWTLLHSLWEGAAIALLLELTLSLARTPRFRYAAACVAMLALVIAMAITVVVVLPEAPQQVKISPRGSRLVLGAGIPQPPPPVERTSYMPLFGNLWIAGALLFQLRTIKGWFAVRRICRTGICSPPAAWQQRLDEMRHHLRISRPVALLESCLADVPVVVGHLRPVILMPVGLLAGLPTAHVEAILFHELAHVRRLDYLVNLLQMVVEGLLYYHPAVWRISSVIRAEREHCCDDAVVAVSGRALEYAAALTALEQQRVEPHPVLASTGGNLQKRIQRMLTPTPPHGSMPSAILSAALLAVAIATSMGAWQQPSQPPIPQPTRQRIESQINFEAPVPPAPQTAQSALPQRNATQQIPRGDLAKPYRKWMDEDVAYIIQDEERAVFQKLLTDAEREQFIEQFWLRRDPTPGTVQNEFKEEFYRRIAYANEHFSSGIPGWRTDRGRMYIIYGPPDEKDVHPSGGSYNRTAAQGGGTTSTYPFEVWRYKYIEGIGKDVMIEFVDTAMNGEYRMTMDPSEYDALMGTRTAGAWTTENAGASVQMMGSNAVLISVPLSRIGNRKVTVTCQVVTTDGKLVSSYRDEIQGPVPIYTRTIATPPGMYRLEVAVVDGTERKVARTTLDFNVK